MLEATLTISLKQLRWSWLYYKTIECKKQFCFLFSYTIPSCHCLTKRTPLWAGMGQECMMNPWDRLRGGLLQINALQITHSAPWEAHMVLWVPVQQIIFQTGPRESGFEDKINHQGSDCSVVIIYIIHSISYGNIWSDWSGQQ